jgi:uncharacterized membrane protein
MNHVENTCHPDDTDLDAKISILLRIGVFTSATVILTGGILFLITRGHVLADYHTFHGVPDHLDNLKGILRGVSHGNPMAIIQLGLVLLIATPVARVILSVFAFAAERDYLYVVISSIVLLVLLSSLIWH